jgi:hypothetical protein
MGLKFALLDDCLRGSGSIAVGLVLAVFFGGIGSFTRLQELAPLDFFLFREWAAMFAIVAPSVACGLMGTGIRC